MRVISGLLVAAALSAAAPAAAVSHRTMSIHGAKKGWWDALARYPVFSTHTPVLNLGTSVLKANARKLVASFLKDAPTFVYNGKPNPAFAFDSAFSIDMAKPNLLSLSLTNYQDVDGAHPSFYFQTFTFGLVQGRPKQLVLQDLFLRGVPAATQINAQLMVILRKKHLSFIEDGTVKELSKEDLNSFVIEPKGVHFWFSPYEIASWAEGPQDVLLKFSAIKGLDPKGPLRGLF